MLTKSWNLLKATAFGDLPAYMKEEAEKGAAAVTTATRQVALDLKAELRSQIMAAFGSQRLANSWQTKAYPAGGKTSLGAAAIVYSKAPHIILAFREATTIVARNSKWLAIPSPECPKSRGSNKRPTPETWNKDRYGPLRLIKRPGKASLLVVDNVGVGKTGKVTRVRQLNKSGTYGRGYASVIMFFLVPMVRLQKRLDPEGAYDRAADRLVASILEEWSDAE